MCGCNTASTDQHTVTNAVCLLVGHAAVTKTPLFLTAVPCSKVTQGMDVLHKLEGLETTKSGIFVMPKERVAIHSTYWYLASKPLTLGMLGERM
jgi:hypothetical protein